MTKLELGRMDYCLPVKDMQTSVDFYQKLDFELVMGNVEQGWAIMVHGNCRLGLYQGHIKEPMLNFRLGDVFAIAEELKKRGLQFIKDAHMEEDGSAGALLKDPDGHEIYFNTHPDEE